MIEGAQLVEREQLLADLAIALTTLYRAGARLPDVELPDDETDEPDPASLVEVSAFFRRVGSRLRIPGIKPEDDGLVPGDPEMTTERFFATLSQLMSILEELVEYGVDREQKEVVAELADDLAEVYHDVRNHLAQLAQLERTPDARWEVRHCFWNHSGYHIVSALRFIHPNAEMSGFGPPARDQ